MKIYDRHPLDWKSVVSEMKEIVKFKYYFYSTVDHFGSKWKTCNYFPKY